MENRVPEKPEQDEEQQEKTPSESYSDFSNTPTSSQSGSQPTSREQTPGVMPKFQYNKDDLIKLRDKPLSRSRPKYLSPDHDNPDGYWDPEIWIRRFDVSRGNSPVTTGASRERKRSTSELEREVVFKKKSSASDPKGRIREEEEDVGIVLSPQRRSFGTGCHVSIMPTRRPPSPNDADRDAHGQSHDQRKTSKIGSGRIQINHDRHEREYRDTRGRYDRDDHRPPFDHPNPLDRFRRDDRGSRGERGQDGLVREREGTRDRLDSHDGRDRVDSRGDGRDSRDRLEPREGRDRLKSRDSRDRLDSRDSRERMDSRDSWDRPESRAKDDNKYRRDYDRRYDRGMRRDYRRQEAEPEWFTGGPSSRSETIELHGFEGPAKEQQPRGEKSGDRRSRTPKDAESRRKTAEKQTEKGDKASAETSSKRKDEAEKKKTGEEDQRSSRKGSVNVTDRNGSLETNESSSPDGSPHHIANKAPQVDPRQAAAGQQSLPNAADFDFNEFFKIDNIPGLTEPPPVEQDPNTSGSRFRQWFQMNPGSHPSSRNGSRRSSINEEFSYLNDLLNISGGQKSPVIPSPPLLEAHRAAMPRIQDPKHMTMDSQQQSLFEMLKRAGATQARPGAPVGIPSHLPPELPRGKTMASSDLEALLMRGEGAAQISNMSQAYPGPQGVTMPSSGKVTTVSELEAGLKQLGLNKDAQALSAITAANKQQAIDQLFGHKQKIDMTSPPSGDMAAFNKLLGMMKATGILQETPKMPRKQDGKVISPINVGSVDSQQKDVLQKMLQQQQTKLFQQQQQSKLQQVKQIQQHQQQQQHHQQQKQVQDQILKFMQHNPGLMPKAAPNNSSISPSVTLQPPPASPRCPSPGIPQQALLQPQQSPSPRAPSPIMFGSQPPMHLTAPSPIHPTQPTPSSPNTLQVSQGSNRAMQRVPSPQELIVHTQAIMQNALIKKQLEDQKERFMKKQQGRSKSPNPVIPGAMMAAVAACGSATSTPVIQAKLTPAFTPTSVIRKMVNDKADREGDMEQGSPEKKPPILSMLRGDSIDDQLDYGNPSHSMRQIPKVDTPPIMTVASDGSISIPVPITPKTPNKSSDANNSDFIKSRDLSISSSMNTPPVGGLPPSHPGSLPQQNFSGSSGQGFPHTQAFLAQMPPGSQPTPNQSKIPRALIGQGTLSAGMPITMTSGLPVSLSAVMAQNPSQPGGTGSQSSGQAAGRAIVKGLGQGSVMSPPNQQHRPVVSGALPPTKQDQIASSQQRPIVRSQQPASVTTQQTTPQGQMIRMPANNRVPRPTNIVRPSTMGISPPTNSSNAMMMQRMVQPTANTAGAGFQQMGVNQLSPLSALQAAQTQARTMDPRLQAGRNVYPMNPLMGSGSSPRGSFPLSSLNRALSPQPQMGPGMSLDGLNGPMTSGIMSHPGVNASNLGALFGAHGAMDGNLAKWFNADLLKHQAPAMPPLPAQGQKVMTVDEIERRQQMVTN